MKIRHLLALSALMISTHASAEGYYIRGDFAYSWSWEQDITSITDTPPPNVSLAVVSPEAVPLGQIGFGYFASPYARADVTGSMTGARIYDVKCSSTPSHCQPGTMGEAKIDMGTVFVNVYYELASIWTLEHTWYHPYIGVGIGAAYHNIHHVVNNLPSSVFPAGAQSYINANADWEFAWRGTAGIAFDIYKGLLVDLAYVYMDAGDAEFGDTLTLNFIDGSFPLTHSPSVEMKTQEAYIGLRYQF